MVVKYNSETGLMYVHFATGVPNVMIPTENGEIGKFVAKSNREQIVGYEVENAADNLKTVLEDFGLSRKQKFAIVMCFIRENEKKTQKEFSTIINVSESTYKSIERAEHNISFDTLDVILNRFPRERELHSVFA